MIGLFLTVAWSSVLLSLVGFIYVLYLTHKYKKVNGYSWYSCNSNFKEQMLSLIKMSIYIFVVSFLMLISYSLVINYLFA